MVNNNFIRFRLTKERTPVSFQVPIKRMMLPRKDKPGSPLKQIQYIPGHESIWKEDQKGDQKPENVWLEDGFLDVHRHNDNLLFILKNHPWFGIHFEIVDEESDDKRELVKFDLIEKAINKVNIANLDELKANAVVLIGAHVVDYSEIRLRKALKQMAYDTPEALIEKMDIPDFPNRLAAALAILREVVRINPTRTAVTWPDGKVIINVAVGQDPIAEFGAYLSQNSEEVRITLQTIGERIKRIYTKRQEPNLDNVAGIPEDEDPKSQEPETEIDKARAEYEKKLGKAVPSNKKNDLEWIQGKLEEELQPG